LFIRADHPSVFYFLAALHLEFDSKEFLNNSLSYHFAAYWNTLKISKTLKYNDAGQANVLANMLMFAALEGLFCLNLISKKVDATNFNRRTG
jgi:hypothetical protein